MKSILCLKCLSSAQKVMNSALHARLVEYQTVVLDTTQFFIACKSVQWANRKDHIALTLIPKDPVDMTTRLFLHKKNQAELFYC